MRSLCHFYPVTVRADGTKSEFWFIRLTVFDRFRSSCKDRPAPCDWDAYRSTEPNPQILYGALVSGPDMNDIYKDLREEYIYNEVTLDYNAGFQSAVAGLRQLELRADADKTAQRSRAGGPFDRSWTDVFEWNATAGHS